MMALNDQQRRIVETLEGSINVVAGAGTGKTFTLTQRIVESVKQRLRNNPDDPNPAGHVLAITFTNKAASELKSRVRAAFLDEASKGGELSNELLLCALTIDDSWISTIHGMAGRILRENAIEFRIDPSFVLLSEQEEEILLSQAVEAAYKESINSGDKKMRDFLDSQNLNTTSEFEVSILDVIKKLLEAISYMPHGIKGIKIASKMQSPSNIARHFMPYAQAVEEALNTGEVSSTKYVDVDDSLDRTRSGINALEIIIEKQCDSSIYEIDEMEYGIAFEENSRLLSALSAFPPTTDTFASKGEYADVFIEYRKNLNKALELALGNLLTYKDRAFLEFLEIVEVYLRHAKESGTTKLSQNDVLIKCDDLLGRNEYGYIANRYREKFDLIMLDEFQDTDRLQISLISKIAKIDSSNKSYKIMSNLCTVGDMQQSIYRFRGGDVEQSQIRMESLREGRGFQMELSENYRSHKDILDTVELIFSQDDSFGSEFLKLGASCQTLDVKCIAIFENRPRVIFDFIHGGSLKGKASFKLDDARRVAAHRIALHFKDLSDRGVKPSEMALLLGKMKNADIYAEALRNVGLECAVTSGSLFSKMQESNIIGDLLHYAKNTYDSNALFQILVSGIFEISDDVLLMLCRSKIDGIVHKSDLASAFLRFEGFDEELSSLGEPLSFAKRLLESYVSEARNGSISNALRELFGDAGVFLDLERKGDAESWVCAGTIKKAIDIVSDLEADASGIAEVSFGYDTYLKYASDTPGTLASAESDFLQIITIHSSKGLEFKHVAVAEMEIGSSRGSNPVIYENIDENTYFAFRKSRSDFPSSAAESDFNKVSSFKSLQNTDLIDDDSLFTSKYDLNNSRKSKIKNINEQYELQKALKTYENVHNIEELRRLMYVAFTRARESLYVSFAFQGQPKTDYASPINDIFTAISAHFEKPIETFDASFSMTKLPISANRIALGTEEMFEDDELLGIIESVSSDNSNANDGPRVVPVYSDKCTLMKSSSEIALANSGLYSYSKISSNFEGYVDEGDDLKSSQRSDEDSITEFIVEDTDVGISKDSNDVHENPLSFGTAFHLIAQAAIIEASKNSEHKLQVPKSCSIESVGKALKLSSEQKERLRASVDLWTNSDLAKNFAAYDQILAEVPFNVFVEKNGNDDSFVLLGEIDGLASDDSKIAHFIDYKTGNRANHSKDRLKEKYEFQAKCYSFALLSSGFENVVGRFVFVEIPDTENDDAVQQPMFIEYKFSLDDILALKSEIIEAQELCD